VGPVTHRDVGLAAFGLWTAFILASLWRWATEAGLVHACALQFFAFFMLPTQMHQRYILPAAVLLALVAPLSRRARWLFVALTLTAALNQGLDLARAVLDHAVAVDRGAVADPPAVRETIRGAATGIAVVHVVVLAWWTAIYRGLLRESASPAP
jgi:hypothetical protein